MRGRVHVVKNNCRWVSKLTFKIFNLVDVINGIALEIIQGKAILLVSRGDRRIACWKSDLRHVAINRRRRNAGVELTFHIR